MKVQARISENGRLVDAHNDEDWALVYRTGKRLFCRERESGCSSALKAVERVNKSKGTRTRFFALSSSQCDHGEVREGVEIRDPSAQPGAESDEHRWLKNYVMSVAQGCGYAAELERTLETGVRADVWVPGAARGRVEVQRVPTAISERTEQYSDVVWLLRENAMTPKTKDSLFDLPCVQVRINKLVMTSDGERRWEAAAPWEEDGIDVLSVSATATVLAKLDTPKKYVPKRTGRQGTNARRTTVDHFESKPIRLDIFLQQIWSGLRHWYPRGPHRYAGWILVDEYKQWDLAPLHALRERQFQEKAEIEARRSELGERPPTRVPDSRIPVAVPDVVPIPELMPTPAKTVTDADRMLGPSSSQIATTPASCSTISNAAPNTPEVIDSPRQVTSTPHLPGAPGELASPGKTRRTEDDSTAAAAAAAKVLDKSPLVAPIVRTKTAPVTAPMPVTVLPSATAFPVCSTAPSTALARLSALENKQKRLDRWWKRRPRGRKFRVNSYGGHGRRWGRTVLRGMGVTAVTALVVAGVLTVVSQAHRVLSEASAASPVTPTAFRLPQENIGCAIGTDADGNFVRCDVQEFSYPVPPLPADCAPADWGHTLLIREGNSAEFGCASNFLLDSPLPIQAYGTSVSSGPFMCSSADTGVTCLSQDGAELRVSRESVYLR